MDLFLIGNDYNISTQLSKLDASHGTILLNNKKGLFNESQNQLFDVPGQSRHIEKIEINKETYYIVSRNNDIPTFLKKN